MQNFKKASKFRSEIVQNNFFSEFMPSKSSAWLEKLRWPVMIVEGQKHSKILKIPNFTKILLKFNILKSLKQFHCLKRQSSIPILSFKQFHWLKKIHILGTKIKLLENC